MARVQFELAESAVPVVAVTPDGPGRLRLRIEDSPDAVFISLATTAAEGLCMALRAGVLAAEERRCVACQGSGRRAPDSDELCEVCGGLRTRRPHPADTEPF